MGVKDGHSGPPDGGAPTVRQPDARPKDDVLRVIEDVESQLARLRRAGEQRKSAPPPSHPLPAPGPASDREGEIQALHAEIASLRVRADEADRLRTEADGLRERAALADRLHSELDGLRHRAESLALELNALRERAALADRLEAELAQARSNDADTERLHAEIAALRHRAEEAGRLESEITSLRGVTAGAQRLRDEIEALRPRADEAERLRAETERLGERAAHADALEQEVNRLRAAHGEIDRLRAEVEAARAAASELAQRVEALQREAEASREREAQLIADLERAAGEQSSDRDQREAVQRSLAEATRRAEDAEERASTACAEAERSRAAAAEHEAQLRDAVDRLAEVSRLVREQAARLERAEAGAADAERIRRQIGELEAKLRAAETERARLREALLSAPGVEAATAGPRPSERLARLRNYRSALRRQRERLERANQTLTDRIDRCEQVLAQRRDLVEARVSIEAVGKRVNAAKARTNTAAAGFFLVGLVAVLGLLSWVIAGQFVQPVYAARAVLTAQQRATNPNPAELEGWQTFHVELLTDPRLLDRVAERMERRGIADLAHPARLAATLETSLVWSSTASGRLELELRGPGAERTLRALDTYVSTLVAEANTARSRRADAAVTVVESQPRLGGEPIEDRRPLYAAAGLGVSSLLAVGFWSMIWRRLARAQSVFEQADRLDQLLEERRWVDPIEQLISRQDSSRAA
ncbi:MAG TPA: hypothetical protein PLU35_07490 [Phycisphaerales bacterium]|nr:hypothetical protein [Phycisphaerales bacterium]